MTTSLSSLDMGEGHLSGTYSSGGLQGEKLIDFLVNKILGNRGLIITQSDCLMGLEKLKKCGISFLEQTFGLSSITLNEILITHGSGHSIKIVSQYILQNQQYSSIVLSPTYGPALDKLKEQSKEIFSIQLSLNTDQSVQLDWDSIEITMKDHAVKLLYLNTNFQNPTGIILDTNTKTKLYNLALENGVIILEDDPYRPYNYTGIDLGKNIIDIATDKKNVIYINSMSKVFSPLLKTGFLVGDPTILQGLSKEIQYNYENLIMQGVSIQALESGMVKQAVQHYINEVQQKYHTIMECLEEEGLLEHDIHLDNLKGGFFAWLKLQNGINAVNVLKNVANDGISFIPGDQFGSQYPNYLRLAFSGIENVDIPTAITQLKGAISKTIS